MNQITFVTTILQNPVLSLYRAIRHVTHAGFPFNWAGCVLYCRVMYVVCRLRPYLTVRGV